MITRSSPSISTSVPDRPFAEQNTVADLDIERPNGAGLVTRTGADCEHFALDWLFLCSIRNDHAAWSLLFRFDALYQNSVMQRSKTRHVLVPLTGCCENNCTARNRLTLTPVNNRKG
jgi:hypothetical protein